MNPVLYLFNSNAFHFFIVNILNSEVISSKLTSSNTHR